MEPIYSLLLSLGFRFFTSNEVNIVHDLMKLGLIFLKPYPSFLWSFMKYLVVVYHLIFSVTLNSV